MDDMPNTIEKEILEILRDEYFDSMSYDTYSKTFIYKGQPLNLNKFNFNFMDKHDLRISDDAMRNLLQNGCTNVFSSIENNLNRYYLDHGTNNSIDTLTKEIFQCKTRVEEIYVKKFLVSAVARALNPGCQVDQVLILQSSKQGIYKTSFFRELAGYDNFSTIRPNMNETELMKLCSCFWLLCYDELESYLNKKTIAKLKSFITTTHDTWRRLYTTSEYEKVPRTFVLCGTTNMTRFLVDSTGERRFWVVNIDKEINIDWVKTNRERLWAEAYHLYTEGYQWWLTKDEQTESNELNQSYKKVDTLTQIVYEYVEVKKEHKEPFRLKDLCNELNINMSRNDLIEVLITDCKLDKPEKVMSYKNEKGLWWNFN